MLIEQTLKTLCDLKLFGMKEHFQWQLEKPPTQDLSFHEQFAMLLDHEKLYRKNKKQERLLKAAHLKHQACLEDLDYTPSRGLKRDLMISLTSCQWIQQAANLLITGPTGVGKSWIASALGHQACRQGYTVFYRRMTRFFEDIKGAKVQGTYLKFLDKIAKTDLLILDDWGLERFSHDQRRDVMELVEDRHHLKSLLITSQVPVDQWHECIADPTLADAILDRLLAKAVQINLKGESLRKKISIVP